MIIVDGVTNLRAFNVNRSMRFLLEFNFVQYSTYQFAKTLRVLLTSLIIGYIKHIILQMEKIQCYLGKVKKIASRLIKIFATFEDKNVRKWKNFDGWKLHSLNFLFKSDFETFSYWLINKEMELSNR